MADLKTAKTPQLLEGKTIALIVEKDSARSALEVAAFDQHTRVTDPGPSGSPFGTRETIQDTTCVLGRFHDAIEYRRFGQDSAEVPTLARGPVSHGLTAEFHPMQGLAELMTMREFTHRHLSDTSFCILGDTGGNLGSSQRMGAALQACCRTLAETSDARITLTGKLANGVEGCDFVRPMSGCRWARPRNSGPGASPCWRPLP